MTVPTSAAPGNPGSPAPVAPATPIPIVIPDFPEGWTREAWTAYCNSPANRAANRIYKRAEALLDDIRGFLGDHGEDVEEVNRRAAGAPAGARGHDGLGTARDIFAGVEWMLVQMVGCCDVLPDGPDDPPAATPAQKPGDGFDAFLAWCKAGSPGFAEHLACLFGAERDREMRYRRRQWAYRSAPIYHDAYAISQLARDLHDRMRAFTKIYDGTEGVTALAALGVPVPHPDEADDPRGEFAAVRLAIATRARKFGKLADELSLELSLEPYTPAEGRAA